MDTHYQSPVGEASGRRVLLAHDPEKVDFLIDALSGLEVIHATTQAEAERLIIEDGINLFILGIHFDDSRALQVITNIRLDKNHKDTPILVVRLSPSEHSDMLRMTLDTLIKLNIVTEFIEFEQYGKNQKQLFRKLVDKLLSTSVAAI